MSEVELLYKYILRNNGKECENLLSNDPCLYTNFSTHYKKTPLMMAVEHNMGDLLHVISRLGYTVNENYNGVYLLDYALNCVKCRDIETLLICGADPNTKGKIHDKDTTVLSKAIALCGPKSEEFTHHLLRYGANPNIQDKLGNNSLHYAVHSRTKILNIVLRYGANCYAKNNHNMTPLDTAVMWEFDDVIKILQDYEMNAKKRIDLLEMARYFDTNSLVHEDYLPLDLLKIFIKYITDCKV